MSKYLGIVCPVAIALFFAGVYLDGGSAPKACALFVLGGGTGYALGRQISWLRRRSSGRLPERRFRPNIASFAQAPASGSIVLIWHFIDFGGGAFSELQASFFDGFANFTLPTDGHYVFFIRGVPWLDPFTPGEFAVSPLFTLGAP